MTEADATAPEYEWGVGRRRAEAVHRSGMTETEARDWVAEVEADGALPGAFFAIRRPIGEWEEA